MLAYLLGAAHSVGRREKTAAAGVAYSTQHVEDAVARAAKRQGGVVGAIVDAGMLCGSRQAGLSALISHGTGNCVAPLVAHVRAFGMPHMRRELLWFCTVSGGLGGAAVAALEPQVLAVATVVSRPLANRDASLALIAKH